jgi:uncharacterized protein (TIGR03083 family)
MVAARPPEFGARLLLTERDALLPILRRTPADAFLRPTVCTGWTVRDVLAHCGAALTRLAEGRLHKFTPELNELDVAERRSWPLDRVMVELEQGYTAAAPALTAGEGKLDGVVLGEWIHGGDVREALGEPGAYGQDPSPRVLSATPWVPGRCGKGCASMSLTVPGAFYNMLVPVLR